MRRAVQAPGLYTLYLFHLYSGIWFLCIRTNHCKWLLSAGSKARQLSSYAQPRAWDQSVPPGHGKAKKKLPLLPSSINALTFNVTRALVWLWFSSQSPLQQQSDFNQNLLPVLWAKICMNLFFNRKVGFQLLMAHDSVLWLSHITFRIISHLFNTVIPLCLFPCC